MSLSVIIPVFNEKATLAEIVRRVRATRLATEIIVVDDGSTDGTREVVAELQARGLIRAFYQPKNQGKGAAVRAGIQAATGEYILIQDADLEYNPKDYPNLLQPIEDGIADAVYGSRFLGAPRRVTMFWHLLANRLLTLATNLLYNSILSDMETGYKAFRASVVRPIHLRANRFDFEPEITAKLLKRGARLFEVPISFNPREYSEGKKIRMRDAVAAVWALVKYRIVE
ncbi:MAG: glycosyltransferase family 2 protein [Anaerolineales bacterium]|jgi:glycosyltransferase involved in cell wall biosynthesis